MRELSEVVEVLLPIAPGYVCHWIKDGKTEAHPVVAFGVILSGHSRSGGKDWRAVVIDEEGRPVVAPGKVRPIKTE